MRSLISFLALGLSFMLFAGCDAPGPTAKTTPTVAAAPPGPPGPPAPPPPPAEPHASIGVLAPPDDVAADAAAPGEFGTEVIEAGVGVGLKGRSLDEHEGIYVTPAKTLFTAKEKIAFEIEIPHAIQLYAALDGDGQGPKTHEEFMEKIVEANKIKLPLLPPGHKYLYDPEKQQLMVERPRKKPAGN